MCRQCKIFPSTRSDVLLRVLDELKCVLNLDLPSFPHSKRPGLAICTFLVLSGLHTRTNFSIILCLHYNVFNLAGFANRTYP